jgi:hypothetical protein
MIGESVVPLHALASLNGADCPRLALEQRLEEVLGFHIPVLNPIPRILSDDSGVGPVLSEFSQLFNKIGTLLSCRGRNVSKETPQSRGWSRTKEERTPLPPPFDTAPHGPNDCGVL